MTVNPEVAPLILAHHTIPNAGFEDRVRAAATAGYDGIGLNLVGYRQCRDDGISDSEMQRILSKYDQRILEVEALRGWSASGPDRQRSDYLAETIFHLADQFGVPYLQAIGPYEGDIDHAANEFGVLCDKAASHEMVVGLEFIPVISNIANVVTARQIVELAGRSNSGICVDIWHFTRGGAEWSSLEELPAELILCVQLNDGTLTPEDSDYLQDCLSNRRMPGQGEFELERFIRTLDSIGCTAPISLEVINLSFEKLQPTEVASQAMRSTRELLAKARA